MFEYVQSSSSNLSDNSFNKSCNFYFKYCLSFSEAKSVSTAAQSLEWANSLASIRVSQLKMPALKLRKCHCNPFSSIKAWQKIITGGFWINIQICMNFTWRIQYHKGYWNLCQRNNIWNRIQHSIGRRNKCNKKTQTFCNNIICFHRSLGYAFQEKTKNIA